MATSTTPADALDVLLRFGVLMLQVGNTAVRTRQWIDVLAPKLGFGAVSAIVSLDSITLSVRQGSGWLTAMRQLGPPGINVSRIAQLEELGKNGASGESAGRNRRRACGNRSLLLRNIPSCRLPRPSGLASGGFAFLNGAAAPETVAAAIGGACGQSARLWLTRRHFNQYGAAALSAIAASGVYVLAAAAGSHFGFHFAQYPAGFIASVLFLVPGFPLVAALFDLLQYQTLAAVSRLAYGLMLLLAVAFGLSIVVGIAGIDVSRQPPFELAYVVKLLLRAVASFIAAYAFAMVFNSPPRIALAAGLVALGANELRLILIDTGMMLAPAAFFATLLIGLVALMAARRFDVPPMAVTVAPTVIMIPGLYAFEMIVLFNRGQVLEALQAFAACFFIVGALAMGLAVARFLSPR